jgi:FlaA1/EpsC-like NDP-sugar epimerase
VALRDRRVVFTGGSGCIGTELLRQLWVNGVTDLISLANTAPTCSVLGVRGNGS